MTAILRSRAWQAGAAVAAFVLVAALHVDNDGLWYGDAALHAGNGLFWWDVVTAMPHDPIDFAVRYYARYPVIKPAGYPPLFYLLEGAAFAAAGPSPYVAKFLVLQFAIVAGLYTMAWARRWIDPAAGWAGAFLAFVPGMVLWSNAVMLNVPAAALGIAALYHFRRWLEGGTSPALAAVFIAAGLLTYFPSASVVAICLALAVLRRREMRIDRRAIAIAAITSLALVPLVAVLLIGPVQAARSLPSGGFLASTRTVAFYSGAALEVLGTALLVLGCAGLVLAACSARWKTEAAVLVVWIAALFAAILPLPATDGRYILLVAPAFTLAAAVGVACAARYIAAPNGGVQAAALAVAFAVAFWSAARVDVPRVSGFREVAEYLRQEAPGGAVLWDGTYGAVFAFYVRALDPQFERRVVAANKLLYEYGPTTTFRWVHSSTVASVEDVVHALRTRSGCRWVVLAVPPRTSPRTSPRGAQLLREAVARPEFELVRSFPTAGAGGRRIEVYRLTGAIEPVSTVDLRFSSFSNREFRQVVPISR